MQSMSIQCGDSHPGNALLVLQHLAGGLCLGPVLGRLLHCLQPLQLLVYALLPALIPPPLGLTVQRGVGGEGGGSRGERAGGQREKLAVLRGALPSAHDQYAPPYTRSTHLRIKVQGGKGREGGGGG